MRLALWRLDGGGAGAGAAAGGGPPRPPRLRRSDGRTARHAAWSADRTFEAAHVLADVLFARGGSSSSEELLADMAVIVTTDEQRAVVAVSGRSAASGVSPTARRPTASSSRPRRR